MSSLLWWEYRHEEYRTISTARVHKAEWSDKTGWCRQLFCYELFSAAGATVKLQYRFRRQFRRLALDQHSLSFMTSRQKRSAIIRPFDGVHCVVRTQFTPKDFIVYRKIICPCVQAPLREIIKLAVVPVCFDLKGVVPVRDVMSAPCNAWNHIE